MFENETNLDKLLGYARSGILSDELKQEAQDRYDELKSKGFKRKVSSRRKSVTKNDSSYLDYLAKSGYNPKTISHYTKEYIRRIED